VQASAFVVSAFFSTTAPDGTAHTIDPDYTAGLLGFQGFTENCMDGVSDRDFLFEIVCACAQTGLHLASFAEDCIVYATEEFALVQLDDAIATGSSIMPHKKNADVFELIRARCGSLIGSVVAMFSILKGLPGAYNRDLQETKSIVFESIQTLHDNLCLISRVIPKLSLKKNVWVTEPALCCATNLMDHIISERIRFREAYHTVGACARQANGDVTVFVRLCAERFDMDEESVRMLLTPGHAVQAKCSKNSTGPRQVKLALLRARRKMKHNKQQITKFKNNSKKRL